MVWGMASPSRLGDFFPDGTFVGWSEELTDYFETKMPTKRKAAFGNDVHSYIYYVAQKFICEPGTINDPDMPPFSAIEPHEAPRRLLTVKKYSSLGSMITLCGELWAADQQMKSIIETLEPGKHFFPLSRSSCRRAQPIRSHILSCPFVSISTAFCPSRARQAPGGRRVFQNTYSSRNQKSKWPNLPCLEKRSAGHICGASAAWPTILFAFLTA